MVPSVTPTTAPFGGGRVCIHVCMYICAHVCMDSCVYVYKCACMRVCVCVCVISRALGGCGAPGILFVGVNRRACTPTSPTPWWGGTQPGTSLGTLVSIALSCPGREHCPRGGLIHPSDFSLCQDFSTLKWCRSTPPPGHLYGGVGMSQVWRGWGFQQPSLCPGYICKSPAVELLGVGEGGGVSTSSFPTPTPEHVQPLGSISERGLLAGRGLSGDRLGHPAVVVDAALV